MQYYLVVSLAIILVIFVLFYYVHQQKKVFARRLLVSIASLKTLIGLCQRHRGLTASLIQGNLQTKPVLADTKRQIAVLQVKLNDERLITDQARWSSFIDHWPRLKEKADSLTVGASFTQHTHLIENLLFLLEDTVEAWQNASTGTQYLSDNFFIWRELPLTVELIGQARAVGMAVSTSKRSTQIDKVKLGYLENKISTLTVSIFDKIDRSKTRIIQTEQAKQACQKLTTLIREELIDKNEVSISSDDYFTIASQTMACMNAIIDEELKRLHHMY